MTDRTEHFGNLYQPVKALVIFKKAANDSDFYIESYNMDNKGMPVNGHPLSVKESNTLAKALMVNEKKSQGYLIPQGIMPANVLHINSNADGWVIWHTPAQKRRLLFSPSLEIPSGKALVPALLWKAGKGSLQVFALDVNDLSLQSTLYKAPFFNVYTDGRICMGNVRVHIPSDCCLEKFMQLWEAYFYDSYFSHTIHGESPVKGNIIQLWKSLIKSGAPFPTDKLNPTKYQLQHLLS